MMSIDLVLRDWSEKKISDSKALLNADHYMHKVTGLGTVNAERTRFLLMQKGLDDQRRLDLQREYQALRKACGLAQHIRPGHGHHDGHGRVRPDCCAAAQKKLPCC
mmetsp:Transcript_52565/g.146745  ORF Transcript_52565/g.146745 Transcript_52565/m.146745 type:complete len:106 (+) Transcript_52565:1-318(+)